MQDLIKATEALITAVRNHHPLIDVDTQRDLYMAYHDAKKAIDKAKEDINRTSG